MTSVNQQQQQQNINNDNNIGHNGGLTKSDIYYEIKKVYSNFMEKHVYIYDTHFICVDTVFETNRDIFNKMNFLFGLLFSYINGANSKKQIIPMTVPVFVIIQGNIISMGFYIKNVRDISLLPKPIDKRLYVYTLRKNTTYVVLKTNTIDFVDYLQNRDKNTKYILNFYSNIYSDKTPNLVTMLFNDN